ncbi:MAG: glycosyltransferase [Candidatus Omnitrophota bacterium]
MSKKRILLMYISENSGHHSASLAVEGALHALSDDIETKSVNSFNYTNPILEKIVNRAYMGIINRTPEVWGYIYDNPRVVKSTQNLKAAIHKYNSHKMKDLLEGFKPHAVICTQAFPCGIVADYIKTFGLKFMLSGILTDYAPHSYWVYDNVDMYFVPSEETKERLIANGIQRDKIKLTGIPIDHRFKKFVDKKKVKESLDLSPEEPIVLVMGGSQGVGPIVDIAKTLNNVCRTFQIIIVCGKNRRLYENLKKAARRFTKKIVILGYVSKIEELMDISSFVISKPGGITVSESFAKGLPVLIVRPIPGHEQMNTEHIVKNRVAVKVENLRDLDTIITELLSNPQALANMQERARNFSRPDSALDIAKTVLERIM